jgi:hypothetical protein
MRFDGMLCCMARVFDDFFGVAISLLGCAFHLQLDTFCFLRFAVHQLACGFLYLASDILCLAFNLVFV